ncbi:hypothetical protein TELCIR_12172 [Teladorsagia circumcincta]|uniref:Uncharacterized protein n=1 Tax=Teladorsagia circumcincta TaxID=45464 RepID=A0A2G9U9H9_TELCI|nr:hypothetical protein TELCIR_12172 [Teladorsagia circumcincta]
MWVSVFVTYPASAAVQALTFGQYIVNGMAPLWSLEPGWHEFMERALGFTLLTVLIVLNFYALDREPMAGSVWAPGKLALAFYGGLWSYAGWDILNYGTPEIEKPTRTMPLSLISGILIVCITYVAINISYFVVLTPDEMKNSTAVAADFAQNTLGNFSYAIPFMVALLLIDVIKVPISLSVFFLVISVGLVLVPFVEEPVVTFTGVAVVASGLVVFYALVKPKEAPRTLQVLDDMATRFTCRLLDCRPDSKKINKEVVKDSDELRGLDPPRKTRTDSATS